MNKLVNYFLRKNVAPVSKPSLEDDARPGTPTPDQAAPAALPEFTPEERSEIFMTLRKTKGSHATQVLISRLKQEDQIVAAIGVDAQVLDTPPASSVSVGDDGDSADDGCDDGDYSTMRVLPSSDEWSTMRVLPDCEAPGDAEFSTVRVLDDDKAMAPKRSGSVERVGLVNRPTKDKKKSSLTRAQKGSAKRVKGGGSPQASASSVDDTPAFLQAFREPEEWELNILALEKGEAREGMGNPNSAFKRWKKDRPSVPSMLLRPDSLPGSSSSLPGSSSSLPGSSTGSLPNSST